MDIEATENSFDKKLYNYEYGILRMKLLLPG